MKKEKLYRAISHAVIVFMLIGTLGISGWATEYSYADVAPNYTLKFSGINHSNNGKIVEDMGNGSRVYYGCDTNSPQNTDRFVVLDAGKDNAGDKDAIFLLGSHPFDFNSKYGKYSLGIPRRGKVVTPRHGVGIIILTLLHHLKKTQ